MRKLSRLATIADRRESFRLNLDSSPLKLVAQKHRVELR